MRPVIRHRRRADTHTRLAVALALAGMFLAALVPLALA